MHGLAEVFAAIGAVGGIVGPTVAVYVAWRLQQVHKLVDGHATMQENRTAQLSDALTNAGVDVPATTQKTGPA